MLPPDVRPAVSTELEPRPKILVTYAGYNHREGNLEAIPQVADLFRQHLQSSTGKVIIYKESALDTPEIARFRNEVFNSNPLSHAEIIILMRSELGREPTQRELDERIGLIEASIARGNPDFTLLHPRTRQPYFLFREMDKLLGDRPREVYYEHHSPDLVRRMEAVLEAIAEAERKRKEYWNEGDFDGFSKTARQISMLLQGLLSTRDREIMGQLEARIRSLMREPQGGSIFIEMGRSHSRAMEHLARRPKFKKSVHFRIQKIGDFPILDRIESDTNHDSPDNIRSELVMIALGQISYDRKNKHETVRSALENVIKDLTIEEIRYICENKVSLADFLTERGFDVRQFQAPSYPEANRRPFWRFGR